MTRLGDGSGVMHISKSAQWTRMELTTGNLWLFLLVLMETKRGVLSAVPNSYQLKGDVSGYIAHS